MKQPPQPWEFRSKPAWQRLLIMVGGVLFNFLLALFIYSMILFAWGDTYIPVQKAPLGMDFNETMHQVGFQDGDVLISADGKPFERMGADLLMGIVDARQVTVLRDGKEASVYIPDGLMDRLLADSVRFADFPVTASRTWTGNASPTSTSANRWRGVMSSTLRLRQTAPPRPCATSR